MGDLIKRAKRCKKVQENSCYDLYVYYTNTNMYHNYYNGYINTYVYYVHMYLYFFILLDLYNYNL